MTKTESARAQRAWHKANPGKNAEYLRKSRLKRKFGGKCQYCGVDKNLEGHACETCRFKKNNANRALLGMPPVKKQKYKATSRRKVDLQNLYIHTLRLYGRMTVSTLDALTGHSDQHMLALQAMIKEGSIKLSNDGKSVNLTTF